MMKQELINIFKEAKLLLEKIITDKDFLNKIDEVANLFVKCYKNQGKIIIFGNGGSACDAEHFAEEMCGKFKEERPALPAISLSSAGFITCVANDYDFDYIFQRGVEAFGQKNDIIIGLSTSGNSKNVKNALDCAKQKNLKTISLLGKTGGIIKNLSDFEWIVPSAKTERIQEIHMMILHTLVDLTEKKLFKK